MCNTIHSKMKKISIFLFGLLFIMACSSNDDVAPNPPDIDSEEEEEEMPLGCGDIYDCSNYGLVAHLSLSDLDAITGNDSWGWTDPVTGVEYALVGLDNGTAFIDISVPEEPVYLGKLPTATDPSVWRDIKTYNDYAYIVSEAPGHGMQVFDLTRLRTVASPPEVFTPDFHYTEFGDAHNIVINEASGYAYAVGTSTYSGGPHIIDLTDPANPVPAGGYADGGYTHDAQVVTYNGPDAEHVGKEIYIGSNEDQVVIVDVTNKDNPTQLSSVSYPNASEGYTHQGWFTEDHTYFLVGDEGDEVNLGFNTRTIILDFSDLDAPVHYQSYLGPTSAIDHNGYVNGSLFYLSNYSAGVRILDISNIDDINEIGYFDTYPDNDNASFNGVWNVYPFFESGNIILSDYDGGFFIIRQEN